MSEEKDLKWYIVHTYSGFENRVKASLEERIKTLGQERYFGKILVPTEQVVELKKGHKKTSSRNGP
jgi:transcriptional antiterminator NusG